MRATSIGHAGILVETEHGTIVCDPWFVPAFFGSWFVFPRNDGLPARVLDAIEHADYLYISHLHADHLDEPWLREHLRRDITVLLPGYPTGELERELRALGFTEFLHTRDGEPVAIGRDGRLHVAIHVETSIADGPQGDSAIVVWDGETRLVNQNDCRPHDPAALASHGPVDVQWLQFSGAIWYPMVYEEPAETKLAQARAKVEAQFSRALRYVTAVDARAVVGFAGPPAFLDRDLFGVNLIDGDEVSIFPDQREWLRRLDHAGITTGRLLVPGSAITLTPEAVTVEHDRPDDEVLEPYRDKRGYLERYAADWAGWLAEHRAGWHAPEPDLAGRLAAWWEPLLRSAPNLCRGIGAPIVLVAGDEGVIVDPLAAEVRPWRGEAHGYRFTIDRRLVETVVDRRAHDWSNALFLSCRFSAWRAGPYNEYVYDFFKSLTPERMVRTEAEAEAKLRPPEADGEEITVGDYVVERYCPHRRADLAHFGELDGHVLTCTLHGWRFDLETGACLTSTDRHLRVRRCGTDGARGDAHREKGDGSAS
jgi:UDP-MurNAc hydroxylase